MAAANYIGNNDYRGYLNYIAQNPNDPNSTIASTALQLVGNDGNYDPSKLNTVSQGAFGSQTLKDFINSSYGDYNNQGGVVLGANTTAPAANPPASYDQAIGNTQQAIDRLPGQLQSGQSGINSSYQDALNQLLLGKNTSQQGYNTAKQQSATGYVGAKNTIGSQAGSTLNGLLRLLGSRGAGGGSAYNTAAPQAVARGATLQRADVGNTFAGNNQSLDQGWGNYLNDYNNQVSSAGAQKDQQQQGLQQSIDSNKASLLQSLAQLQAQKNIAAGGTGVGAAQPYLDQANSLLDHLSNYSVAPIKYNTQAYQAPSLASYTTAPQAAPNVQGQGGGDYFSPYLSSLLGKKQPNAIA